MIVRDIDKMVVKVLDLDKADGLALAALSEVDAVSELILVLKGVFCLH